MVCDSQSIKKDGSRKTIKGVFQRYKCKECNYSFTLEQKFIKQKTKSIINRLDIESIESLQKNHNLSLREIARQKKVALSTLQYFIKKNKK